MTKQNRIHKLLVLRQKGRKEVRKILSVIPDTFEEYIDINVKRKRTYSKAYFTRLKRYEGWVYDNDEYDDE